MSVILLAEKRSTLRKAIFDGCLLESLRIQKKLGGPDEDYRSGRDQGIFGNWVLPWLHPGMGCRFLLQAFEFEGGVNTVEREHKRKTPDRRDSGRGLGRS
jgi:hypothetical protein